jgi:hypothetical protein
MGIPVGDPRADDKDIPGFQFVFLCGGTMDARSGFYDDEFIEIMGVKWVVQLGVPFKYQQREIGIDEIIRCIQLELIHDKIMLKNEHNVKARFVNHPYDKINSCFQN